MDLHNASLIEITMKPSGRIPTCISNTLSIVFEDVDKSGITALLQKYHNITNEHLLSERVKYDLQHHVNTIGPLLVA